VSERIQTESRIIILGPYESVFRSLGGDVRDYQFPVLPTPPIRTGRTKVFPARATLGPADPDVDDTLTTLNFMDLSAGAGVYTIKPASDLNNYWWGVASAEGTDGFTAAREAIMRQPSVYTGNCVPVGRIGVSTYVLWGSDLHLWDPDAQTFGNTAGDVGTVVNTEGIASFNGRMFFPLGSSGYSYTSESSAGVLNVPTTVAGAATPAYSATPGTSNPRVLAFAVWNDLLWALTTAAEGYAIVPSLTGNTGDWTWSLTADQTRQTIIKIESSFEPKTLAVFPNAQNQQSLWVAGRRGLKVLNLSEGRWDDTVLTDVPPHPDFGRAMKVFRPGEALHIAGGGGDVIQYTVGGAVVPASGPGGDGDGMPAERRGSVISFATDLAHLYALFRGGDPPPAVDPIDFGAKFGTTGTGNGELNAPKQVAIDSGGDIYVADSANSRLQRFSSAGTYEAQITGVSGIQGVAVDASLNIYVSYGSGALRKYNSSLVLQWDITLAGTSPRHVATDGTHVYVCTQSTDVVYKRLCSTGAAVATLGSAGTGDGQFANPVGIAYSAATGTLLVVDSGNDRVQEITTSGTFVRKWGSAGTGDGEFGDASGIAVTSDGSKIWVADGTLDRVQMFTGSGAFLAEFGSTGTADGEFDTPNGIAITGDDLAAWVADEVNDRVQRLDDSGDTVAPPTTSTVMANTGKGWHPAWESNGETGTPTKIVVSDMSKAAGTTDYRAFWGIGEECWSFQCRLQTHSARQAIQTGTGERFSTDTYGSMNTLEWGPFHGGSIAIHKLASHAALTMEHATTTDYVAYQYMTDHAHDEAWITLGTATTDASDDAVRTVLPFGLTADEQFSEGLNFHWIRQRLQWVTATATRPAIVTALTLAYLPITQDAATKAYTVPLPQDRDPLTGKTAEQIINSLEDLLAPTLGEERFLFLQDGQRQYRAFISSISYGRAPTPDGPGALTLSLIQIPTGVSSLIGEA
jgi:DNA-binding beta-propeller fold protein YncE